MALTNSYFQMSGESSDPLSCDVAIDIDHRRALKVLAQTNLQVTHRQIGKLLKYETSTFTRTTVFAADSTPTNAAGSATNAAGSIASSAGSAVSSATGAVGSAAESATSAAAGSDDASGAAATTLPMLGAGAGALIAVFGLL